MLKPRSHCQTTTRAEKPRASAMGTRRISGMANRTSSQKAGSCSKDVVSTRAS